jgi:hypothetical protein
VCESDGRVRYRIDLGYRDRWLGLEYDGEAYHGSAADQARDVRRRSDLRERFGWDVYAFTRAEVLGRRPDLELVVGAWSASSPGCHGVGDRCTTSG